MGFSGVGCVPFVVLKPLTTPLPEGVPLAPP